MSEKLDLTRSEQLYEEARKLVPGGILGIRRPYNFVPGEYPVFFDHALGGRCWDVDGNEFVDMLAAYGPIILGHREAEIDAAVVEQMAKGFCMNLAQPLQNQLAAKLIELIPCAEKVVLVKTGSDATTAAIRIARGVTGRLKVLRCGYHGWHDWCVEQRGGIPEKYYEDTHEFHYNDIDDLDRLLDQYRDDTAAIIITPLGHPLAHPIQEPAPGFLEAVRERADAAGIVLIFDEVRTGFRVALGGAQERYGVTPDLATFGKAMANGYPISAVVGKADFMNVVEGGVFVSSTFFPNSLEMAAALKTIEILEREKALDTLWERGEAFLRRVGEVVEASGVPAELSGIPPMPFITFPSDPDKKYKARRTLFYTELIRRGVFLQPYHHGYLMCRHTEADVVKAIDAIEESLAVVRREIP
ncbi:MAG: aminotransferase class III-fold pyridoxal phosphate-dependent enzyme [Candidatus Lernaella stagnicola]|nr:aminotransferase class III-fold pyridoxal phosphate-dependent enzyme [Candidatus Lernaella stagnicola]